MWERLCALSDARRTGRPTSPQHLLSGLMVCAACGRPMRAHPRHVQRPYPDGQPRRDYRCRKVYATDAACGLNYIDARVAEAAVAAAAVERLGDPRRAERIAQRLAQVGARGSLIEAEITRWEGEADALAAKTASWGVARVDRSMGRILSAMDTLRGELAALETPDSIQAATADAVAAWRDARERGDVELMRRMIRSAFPDLAVAMPSGRGDHNPTRILWTGSPTPKSSRWACRMRRPGAACAPAAAESADPGSMPSPHQHTRRTAPSASRTSAAASPVEREHPLRPAPLPQRLSRDHALQHHQGAAMAPQREPIADSHDVDAGLSPGGLPQLDR